MSNGLGEELLMTWTPSLHVVEYFTSGWELYQDGSLIDTGSSWSSDVSVFLDLTDLNLSPGTYEFRMRFVAVRNGYYIDSECSILVEVIGTTTTTTSTEPTSTTTTSTEPTSTTTTSTEPTLTTTTSSTTESGPVFSTPGLEMLILLVAVVVLIGYRRRKQQG